MATTKNTRYVATEGQEDYAEGADFSYADEPAVDDAAGSEPRCAACGALAGLGGGTVGGAPDRVPGDEAAEPVVMVASSSGFAYGLGHRVQPAFGAQAGRVVWRGQLKERSPATGLVQRVPVYVLDDGYWDCYREEELRVA